MQAALQAFVDNSLSKTVNFPSDASEADVAHAYQLAWELGCKGITVYVTGSRQKVVLETKATARQKQTGEEAAPLPAPAPVPAQAEQLPIWHDKKKPRPRSLKGYTYSVSTPLGKAFVTINENGGDQPFEVFINTAKAGSDTAAVSEAIGRLISYILRLSSSVRPARPAERSLAPALGHRRRAIAGVRPQEGALPARRRGANPGGIPGKLRRAGSGCGRKRQRLPQTV